MEQGLNFHKIGKTHNYPAVVKLLAREFIEGASYFSVGKWFQELSTYDLDMLIEMSERFEEEGYDGEVTVVLTEMLTSAEGVEVLDMQGARRRVAQFISLLIMESLYRKGKVEMDHSAISFGDDEMENVIAWPKGTPKPIKKPPKLKKG